MSWCWSFISVQIETCWLPLCTEHSSLWSVTMVILLGDPTVKSLNLWRPRSMLIDSKSYFGYQDSAWDVVLDAKARGLAEVMSSPWASTASSPVMCVHQQKWKLVLSCQNIVIAHLVKTLSTMLKNTLHVLFSIRILFLTWIVHGVLLCMMHRKLINSSLLVGDEMWSNASILEGTGLMPSLSISIPQNLICFSLKLYFSGFSVRSELDIACITCRITSSLCSLCILVAMIRSSCIKYTWGILAKIGLSARLSLPCADWARSWVEIPYCLIYRWHRRR